jgi:hypothetical protein
MAEQVQLPEVVDLDVYNSERDQPLLDTRTPELVHATRTNIVSDGPGTVGY